MAYKTLEHEVNCSEFNLVVVMACRQNGINVGYSSAMKQIHFPCFPPLFSEDFFLFNIKFFQPWVLDEVKTRNCIMGVGHLEEIYEEKKGK